MIFCGGNDLDIKPVLELFGFPFSAMGTECNLYFYAVDEPLARKLADAAMAEVARIEGRYSRYDPESLLSTINRAASSGGSVELDAETAGFLDHAFECHS